MDAVSLLLGSWELLGTCRLPSLRFRYAQKLSFWHTPIPKNLRYGNLWLRGSAGKGFLAHPWGAPVRPKRNLVAARWRGVHSSGPPSGRCVAPLVVHCHS